MANTSDDLNLQQQSVLPPEIYQQQQALNRQQQMAAMLMGQNQQPQGQMISGRYVAPSFFQNLQPVANMLTGAYLAKQGDTKAADLARQLREGREAEKQAAVKEIQKGDVNKVLSLPNEYGGVTPFIGAAIKSSIPELSSEEKLYNRAVQQGYKGGIVDFINEQNRSKANNTIINMGQHGFENTMKLGEGFKSEPIYKTHQVINQAYNQINSALDKNNAAGDLTAAIKINKLLDPDSIVRESEVATVANATGLLDKLSNYASQVAKGTRLNPEQRKEYRQLAKDFYAISGQQYNQTRNKYAEMGRANQLSNVDTILGAEWKAPVVSNTNVTKNMEDANKILGIPSMGGK